MKIKKTLAKETILIDPDFGNPFYIYADVIQTQLGGTIQQEANPLSFYSVPHATST